MNPRTRRMRRARRTTTKLHERLTSGPFSYEGRFLPRDYRCGRCRAAGVKLWRDSETFCLRLRCARCALVDQGVAGPVGPDGRRYEEAFGMRTDQIGVLVPAVPNERGTDYLGYTLVPRVGVAWWRALPTRLP